MDKKVKVGARKSALAQIQSQRAATALGIEPEFVGLTTEGDKIQDKSLRDLGGKELFVREVEQALLAGEIDLAVHSLKDLPAPDQLPKGLALGAVLPRENPYDGLVSAQGFKSLDELPQGARVGTASPRRTAQLKHHRSDLEIVLLRGNVDTRLKKIKAGELDAAVLAMAGLARLGKAEEAIELDAEVMLPAAAQGVICIQCRADDKEMLALTSRANDPQTQALVAAEREFSSSFGASCYIPCAALARWEGAAMTLTAELLTPDGAQSFKETFSGQETVADPLLLGKQAAEKIKALAGEELLAAIRKG